jgi:hypothetical protein
MSRKRKKQSSQPRTWRMKRPTRLQSARQWLASQNGRSPDQIAKSYRKRYRVDWPCAILELRTLGIRFDRTWVEQLERPLAGATEARRRRKLINSGNEDCDETFAYIAGFTPGGAPFGVTWEEFDRDQAWQKCCDPHPHEISDEEIPF